MHTTLNSTRNHQRTRQQGFTLLELMTVVGVVAIIAAVAIPQFLTAKKSTNEGAAISSLRSIGTSSEMYKTRFDVYPTVPDLISGGFIDNTFAGPRRGYSFTTVGTVDTSNWSVVAEPQNHGQDGDRFFYLDQTGVIRASQTGRADGSSLPVD